MKDFLQKLKLYTHINELGVKKEDLENYSKEVTGNLKNDPASEEENIIDKIYQYAY